MESTTVSDRDGQRGADPARGAPADDHSRWQGPVTARRVGQAAVALIALQAVFRGWAVLSGFYYEDDFIYVHRAATEGLSADYLLQDYNGHLMPGEFFVVWLLQSVAPMSFTLVGTVVLLLQVLAASTVWCLIRELVGPRPGALLPLAVYLFSPLTLGSFLWYAAALQAVPLQLVLAGSLLFHVRYLRTGRARDALCGVLIVAVGLLFWEKALLAVPLLAAVTVLFFGSGGPVTRVVSAVASHWRLWAAYAVLSGVYLAFYVSQVEWQLRSRGDRGMTFDLVREAVLTGFVPTVFGGPYTGFPTELSLAPNPSLGVQLVFVQALLLVVAGTVLMNRGAWRAWALLAAYLLVDCLLVAGGRLDALGPIIGRDTRYLADASVVAAVALALALFPRDEGPPSRFSNVDLARALDRPVVLGIVLLFYINSSAITSTEIVQRWGDTSAESYVRTAQADLKRLGNVSIYDSQPPDDVLTPWYLLDHRVSRIIGPLPEKPRFDRPTGDLRVVDDEGRLRPAEVQVAEQSRPGPDQTCGWPVTGGAATTIQMQQALYSWRWTVRISYFAGAATPGRVSLGDSTYRVRFQEGLHNLYLVHTGPVDAVRIERLTPGLTVCVPQVAIGQI